jgi:diguanylate cyclase (GGDEF)-like protein
VGDTVLKFVLHDEMERGLFRTLQERSNIDELTGLVVRRRFAEELELALAECLRSGRPISVLMMDMDNLKQINDRHGHPKGAHAISETGRIIGDLVAGKGLASRFGGDEFHAYLVGHDTSAALEVGEEIRSTIAAHPFEKDGVRFEVTISIGVATAPEGGTTADALIDAADRALYRAKAAGRNRVCR